jgi:hypothetical protein
MRTTVSARAGRRIALVLLFGSLAAFVTGATAQIVRQVFWPAPASGDERNPGYPTCRAGLAALHDAVDRARGAAEGEADVEAALARFRTALQPEWGRFEAIRGLCEKTEADQHSLDAVERLRYAEEHAVRREAGSLEVLRKQVAKELAGASSAPAAAEAPSPRAP